ncbi:hypothetical protein ACN47E_004749 [Coniothyrium glycines]
MASTMDWSHEFCLSCDRQLDLQDHKGVHGVYCSQSCRLADLEKSGSTGAYTSSHLSSSASSTSSSNNGFYLPPAVNFSQYKGAASTVQAPTSPYHYYPTQNGAYFAPPTATRQAPQRSLTPSSSRSSLASNASHSQPGISQQAATQLNSYMRSFDQTRDQKRRYTQY